MLLPSISLAADNYGVVHGRALDRDGNTIPDVTVTLLDRESRPVVSAVTSARGEYSFDRVPMEQSQETFKIRASFNKDGRTWSSETAFFYVNARLISAQDVRFYDYPLSGIGGLYGIVTDNDYFREVPATVYLDNGMFFLYSGNRYDQWSFDNLPRGKYVLWAERNVNNVTYASRRYEVTVPSDEKAYLSIYLPMKDPVEYHPQPAPLKNEVHGMVVQKNGALLPDARVDLYRFTGSSAELVASTYTNINGRYIFDNVNVDRPSAQFMVRVTFEADGARYTQDSETFIVYYANTLNVPHSYNVPVTVPQVITGIVTINSVPQGAWINIDGMETGHVTPYNVSLTTGKHLLGLSMDGYFCDNTTLEAQPGTAMTINRTLKLSTGNLSLQVNPASARVYIDGKLIGTGPVTLEKKQAGDYSFTLACDGYCNESGILRVLPGESVTKEINMIASPGISLTYIAYLISSLLESIGRIL